MKGKENSSAYEFSVDWFSENILVWDRLLRDLDPAKILEIGCYEGRATCYMIERCSAQHAVELFCVDTWQGGVEHDPAVMNTVEQRFDSNVALARQRAVHPVTVHKRKEMSSLALAQLITANMASPFDLIYVDGSHQAPDVLTDAVLSFQLLRVGGLMIFDDYLWCQEPEAKQDPLNMPKPAIDAFLNLFQRKIRVWKDLPLYQLYVTKTHG